MKTNWQTKKLGDICDVYQPKTISAKEMTLDGKYVVFGANGIIGKYDKYNHEEPQLLITCRGATCGSVNISEPKSWINGNAMVVRPKDNSLDLKFLEYLFRGGLNISKVITGAAQPQITRTNLEPIEISYPILLEQKRIVKILDEAFEKLEKVKENTEKNLQNSKELFESYLNNIFSNPGKDWEEKLLGNVCVFENGDRGKNYPAKSKLHAEGIPFVTAGNIDKHDIFLKGKNYLSDKQYKLLSRGKFVRGDILFCLRGSLGKFALVRSVECGAIASSLMIVRPSKEITSNFLYYYFQSGLCDDMIKKYKGGAAQPNLGAQDVKKFDIYIPSLIEQKSVVRKLDQLSEKTQRLESLYKQKLENIEELKKSILSKAFSKGL